MVFLRKCLLFCIAVIIALSCCFMCAGAEEDGTVSIDGSDFFPPMTKQERLEKTVYLQDRNYAAACDGVLTVINKADKSITPAIVNNKLYVPLRFVLEHFRVNVGWEHETKTVVMTAGDKQFRLSTADGVFSLGEKSKTLEGGCIVDRGTTFVSFDDISEIIYCDTYYYPENKAGVIAVGANWKPDERAEKSAVSAMEFAISPFFKMFI